MRAEESSHRQRLTDLFKAKFGNHIPLVRRQDVKGFVQRKPVWLVRPLGIDTVRNSAATMTIVAGTRISTDQGLPVRPRCTGAKARIMPVFSLRSTKASPLWTCLINSSAVSRKKFLAGWPISLGSALLATTSPMIHEIYPAVPEVLAQILSPIAPELVGIPGEAETAMCRLGRPLSISATKAD